MNIKDYIREDLWNAIKQHYTVKDYTESLRDAGFLLKDILQDKSGEFNKDNVKLVDAVLLGANPTLKINGYSTPSEKDFQMGIALGIKGIFSHVRNPISHDKIIYSQEDANAILLYVDYIIRQIDKSSGMTLIEEWIPLLKKATFTDTEDYAQELIKELPKKKSLDLIIALYEEREQLPHYKLKFFIKELVAKLTAAQKTEFIGFLDKDLAQTEGGHGLSIFFHYFAEHFYVGLKKVVKLRIEDVVLHGIEKGVLKEDVVEDANAAMATWAKDYIPLFETKNKIINKIWERLFVSKQSMEYIFNYFKTYVDLRDPKVLDGLESKINFALPYNSVAYDFLKKFIFDKQDELYLKFKDKIDEHEEKYVQEKLRLPNSIDDEWMF